MFQKEQLTRDICNIFPFNQNRMTVINSIQKDRIFNIMVQSEKDKMKQDDLQMSQVVEVKKELVPLFNNIFVNGKTGGSKILSGLERRCFK